MGYIEQNRARIKRYMQEYASDATDAKQLARLACEWYGIHTGFGGIPEIVLEIAREVISDA